LRWSKYIGKALYRFGFDAEVMFASHALGQARLTLRP
jgi:alkyl sulfatase BDS1-like metallo-beta-lactamase superfamily hydrolase